MCALPGIEGVGAAQELDRLAHLARLQPSSAWWSAAPGPVAGAAPVPASGRPAAAGAAAGRAPGRRGGARQPAGSAGGPLGAGVRTSSASAASSRAELTRTSAAALRGRRLHPRLPEARSSRSFSPSWLRRRCTWRAVPRGPEQLGGHPLEIAAAGHEQRAQVLPLDLGRDAREAGPARHLDLDAPAAVARLGRPRRAQPAGAPRAHRRPAAVDQRIGQRQDGRGARSSPGGPVGRGRRRGARLSACTSALVANSLSSRTLPGQSCSPSRARAAAAEEHA